VWGVGLATLTNIVVFVPIPLIQEEVGRCSRHALAICAGCVEPLACITAVPTMAPRLMKKVQVMRRHPYGHETHSPCFERSGRCGNVGPILAMKTVPLDRRGCAGVHDLLDDGS
jgi:hypothetical protein